MKLLGTSSYKTQKGESAGYLTGILYLISSDASGTDLCPGASPECRKFCLLTAGRGVMQNVIDGRMRKTRLFLDHREEFKTQLRDDIRAIVRQAARENMTPCVRLDGTSDAVAVECYDIMREFPHVQFYDYTKIASKFTRERPANYHLTFSRSETNEKTALRLLARGENVAVVFANTLPETWHGFRVINGDTNDLRFLDDKNVVVGLTAKGRARGKENGFVVHV